MPSPRSSISFAALALLISIGVGCGQDGGDRVPEEVQRALPTQQYALSEEVCPEVLGMPPQQERETKRRGQRQLRALLDAYRSDPDAVVRTTYSESDSGNGVQSENLTVEKLLETHLSTAEEIADGSGEYDCFDSVAQALRSAQGGG